MGTSHTVSFYIVSGSCQICVNSPILRLRKWRPRKVKSLGQGSIPGMRPSLDLDTDLSVFPLVLCSLSPTHPSAPVPRGSLMLQNPLGLLSSPASQPSSNCSVWTPGPSAGLGPAHPPAFPAAYDLRTPLHLPLSHPIPAAVVKCSSRELLTHGLIPCDTLQKLGWVLGWIEYRPTSQVILEPTTSL